LSSVQIRILTGPNQGARLRVGKDHATFGRAPECDITIDQPFVSREHGRLALTPKGWVLENLSPNGTVVAGKTVTRKPRAIADGQIVCIGAEQAFEIISLAVPADAPAPAEPDAQPAEQKKKLSGRSKLWIGLGAYAMVMMLLFVFLSLFGGGDNNRRSATNLPQLSTADVEQRVKAEIRRTLPKRPPDSLKVREHSEAALEHYHLRTTDPTARYRALVEYRLALAYTRGDKLEDPEHDTRYIEVQEELVEDITRRYSRAYNLLRNNEPERADSAFRELSRIYADPSTQLHRDIETYWAIAKQQLR